MPSFGTNPNVMCYLDDIYIYLQGGRRRRDPARAAGEARGQAREPSPRPRMPAWADARALALAAARGARRARRRRRRSWPISSSRTAFRVCADPANLPFSNEDGRGLRERDRRALRREARAGAAVHLVSRCRWASCGARCVEQPLRRDPGLRPGRRAGAEHQPLLHLDARAGDARRQRPRRRDDARRPAAAGPADRGDRRQPAGEPPGAARADGRRSRATT